MYQTDAYEDHEKKRVSAQLQSKVLHARLVCLRPANAFAREMKHQGHEGCPFWEPDSRRSDKRIYQSVLSRNILNLIKSKCAINVCARPKLGSMFVLYNIEIQCTNKVIAPVPVTCVTSTRLYLT
jgi:hypothetical protein